MSAKLNTIQPIVLVGGQSKRFGRDKLREPLRRGDVDSYLVDAPIAALREIFGRRVALVGECHHDVAGRADSVIEDRYAGVGPIGGIVSALQATGGDVFVLAGDMPLITADAIRRLLKEYAARPDAAAVLARSDRLEPCVGIYRQSALPVLLERLQRARRSLHDALPASSVATVQVDPRTLISINTPDALRAAGELT